MVRVMLCAACEAEYTGKTGHFCPLDAAVESKVLASRPVICTLCGDEYPFNSLHRCANRQPITPEEQMKKVPNRLLGQWRRSQFLADLDRIQIILSEATGDDLLNLNLRSLLAKTGAKPKTITRLERVLDMASGYKDAIGTWPEDTKDARFKLLLWVNSGHQWIELRPLDGWSK